MKQPRLDLFSEGYIKGSLIQEIYYNEENGFGVYLIRVEESNETLDTDEVVIVGHFIRPHPDEVLTCYGEWVDHARYGLQYHVHRVKKEVPRSAEAVIKYLSSGLFPGVGKVTAQKIVDHLGPDALDQIAANPDILSDVPGLSASRAQAIADHLREHHAIEQALVFLYEFGMGPTLALKVVQQYKQETIERIKENPYRLIDDVEGVGFRRADEIARRIGIASESPERFQAAALYAVKEAALSGGHVFVTAEELKEWVDRLLDDDNPFSREERDRYLSHMVEEGRLFEEEGKYYLPSLYYAERGVALRIRALLEEEVEEIPVHELYRAVGEVEEELGVAYADKQREAMMTAVTSPMMILTGGPGTGKTTVIRGICHLFARLKGWSLDPKAYEGTERPYPIRLVAPTGRAAKRMSEATGLPAMTIHRLLGWRGEFFEHDADHPISGSVLIVDEVSMMDIWLANQLLRSVPKGMQVLFVGDQDQLPSVGPGNVLHHLLQVEAIPRVELTEIFRQEKNSSIIHLAHALKRGELPDDLLEPQPDRRFFPCSREQVLKVILQTYQQALNRGYTLFDVQVLAPIYKGPAGVDRINRTLQEAVNPGHPDKKEIAWGDHIFRLGDKVLQLVNHPEHPIYNGDMGLVVAIQEEAGPEDPVLWVRFDQVEVPYKRNQLNQIALSYACSVHKAQGSEFPIVIFPVLHAYRRMLQHNLIYTGITRSKSYLILCGELNALSFGVRRQDRQERNSCLVERIRSSTW